ncbi:MAG: DEAD/DEAH box helicase [Flavobacteriales bacterium]|nr:DEAD/DEAH box helicase [Flavobacteriales bacterium]
MDSFDEINLNKQLRIGIDELGFERPTPIQEQAFPVVMSGKNVVGIAQTGTGKTLAYMMPILQNLKFSKQLNPRVLILVPTRELVLQVVEQIEMYGAYMSLRVIGVYGGTNINTQATTLEDGADILVATPGRLYDLALSRAANLKAIKQLVIDEVDVMLDLGFRFQLANILELLPEKRQNIMFSATMTDEVSELIDEYFIAPERISIALSGTPLENISQTAYAVPNFYTKVNLLSYLLQDKTEFNKVLVFVPSKKIADRLFDAMEPEFGSQMSVIHSNKSQNYRIRSIEQFNGGKQRILIATDVMARGLDLEMISHVINFDVPNFPENYMHRIGRTGRAEQEGQSIVFFTEAEQEAKEAIELLMDMEIPLEDFPDEVEVSEQLIPDERSNPKDTKNPHRNFDRTLDGGGAYHEKKEKNKKTNLGGSYRPMIAKKYKKPKTRGSKSINNKKKK